MLLPRCILRQKKLRVARNATAQLSLSGASTARRLRLSGSTEDVLLKKRGTSDSKLRKEELI